MRVQVWESINITSYYLSRKYIVLATRNSQLATRYSLASGGYRLVELIANPVNRVNILRHIRVRLQFRAQPSNVHINRARSPHEIVPPNPIQQHLARKYLQRMRG